MAEIACASTIVCIVPINLDAMDIRESSKPKATAEDNPSTIPVDTIFASYRAASPGGA
jgi:hypothetical protein